MAGVQDGKLFLSGLEEMGDTVLNHFKKCLEFQYPADSLGSEPSLMEVLKIEHETFMFQRSQVYCWVLFFTLAKLNKLRSSNVIG